MTRPCDASVAGSHHSYGSILLWKRKVQGCIFCFVILFAGFMVLNFNLFVLMLLDSFYLLPYSWYSKITGSPFMLFKTQCHQMYYSPKQCLLEKYIFIQGKKFYTEACISDRIPSNNISQNETFFRLFFYTIFKVFIYWKFIWLEEFYSILAKIWEIVWYM